MYNLFGPTVTLSIFCTSSSTAGRMASTGPSWYRQVYRATSGPEQWTKRWSSFCRPSLEAMAYLKTPIDRTRRTSGCRFHRPLCQPKSVMYATTEVKTSR